ncbi:MAG: LacI family DNA-binding transcriptional regulator [Verrucomicrobiia bacterium]
MKEPGLKDVAARAGVSLSTASAALNGLALVRETTRERVRQAARELGYWKDASAAVLATRRKRSRTRPGRLSLGYLVSPTAKHRRSEAFEAHAHALGYGVEWVDLRSFEKPSVAARALWHRNVAGLFYASPNAVPLEGGWEVGFDWSRFAVVKFSRARPELRFDLIRHSAFDFTSRAIREVAARGYRRLAVILGASGVPQDDEARLGAILGWKALRGKAEVRVEWRMLSGELGPNRPIDRLTETWLERFEPDAVIAFPEGISWQIRASGWEIPGRFAFAGIAMTVPGVAGCPANHRELAIKAVELLDRNIKLGLRGPVGIPQETVIEPEWVEGESLPIRETAGSEIE